MALVYTCPGAFTSLQVYDDLAYNSGSLLATFDSLVRVSERETKDIHELEVEAGYIDAAQAHLAVENVIRLNIGSCFREFRINEPAIRRDQNSAETILVRADYIGYELDRGFIREKQANGQVNHHLELESLDPSDMLTAIFTHSHGLPAHFKQGTIASGPPVSLVMDKVSTRSALILLAEEARGTTYEEPLELEVVRDTADNRYQVNLVERRGASLDTPTITYAVNELSMERRIEGDDIATRVFPFGAGAEGEDYLPMTLADNWWIIASISGTTITLEDDIAIENDQHNSLYVVSDAGGTPTAVTDTIAPNQIVVASASGFTAGRRLKFVEDSAGSELTYLESPSGITTFGERVMKLERSDIPFVVNWALNGYMRNWRSGGRGRPWCIPNFNVLDDIASNDPIIGNPPSNTGGTGDPGGSGCTIARTQHTFIFSDNFGGGQTLDYLPGWFTKQCHTLLPPDPPGTFCFGGDLHSGFWIVNASGQAESGAVAGGQQPFGSAVKFGVGSYQTMVLQADLTPNGADIFLMIWQDVDHWYMGGVYHATSSDLNGRIFKMDGNNGISQLATGDITPETESLARTVKFVHDFGLGEQKLYIDNALIASASDSALTGLKFAGFRAGTGVDWRQTFCVGDARVDNFYAAGQGYGNRIRVFGLGTGDKVLVYGQTVTETAGVVLIDIGTDDVPDTGPLIVQDSGSVELARWDLEPIHPGSEYELICP